MAKQVSEEQIYEEARLRVKAKKDFWGHLGAWAAVSVILIVVWALNYDPGGSRWFLWPVCIWGIFVLFHYLRVFVFERKSDRGAIEKEVERIKREQS